MMGMLRQVSLRLFLSRKCYAASTAVIIIFFTLQSRLRLTSLILMFEINLFNLEVNKSKKFTTRYGHVLKISHQ